MSEQMVDAQVLAEREQENNMMTIPKVYRAINAVQAELAKTGISKDRRNTQGSGYMFRGIDDVYNALSPLLAKHGLCIMPRILNREIVERQSQKGGALFYVTVEAEFDFVAAEDGSRHTVRTFGEAMDSGDKATNKAMSAAYKYAAFQAFAIPTEGDNDADAQTHEVKAQPIPPALMSAARDAANNGVDAYRVFWESQDSDARKLLRGAHATLKAAAMEADAAAEVA